MTHIQQFLVMLTSNSALVLILFALIGWTMMRIQRLTLPGWNGFLDSLDRHGGHIFVGGFFTIVGIIMLKVMLVDDGKGVIGFGLGVLSRSMGTHPPESPDPALLKLLQKYKDSDPDAASILSTLSKPVHPGQ